MRRTLATAAVIGWVTSAAVAEIEIWQAGLVGFGQSQVFLPLFDDDGGNRILNSVTIESMTSLDAGYTDPHTGSCVGWWMSVGADYRFDGVLVTSSGCSASGTANCDNSGIPTMEVVSCTSGDWQGTTFTSSLNRWIGTGSFRLDTDAALDFGSDSDLISMGASHAALVRVVYDHGFVIPPTCQCNAGGGPSVDVFDLLAYLDLWFAGDPDADIDSSPGVDVFDLLVFLDCWFIGC